MKLSIREEKDETLMSRKRYFLDLEFEGATPSRAELSKKATELLKADKDRIYIERIGTDYGMRTGTVEVCVYDTPELMATVGKVKPVEEAPAEKPAEEKPAEEKPAEKPAEEKPAEKPADAPEKKE